MEEEIGVGTDEGVIFTLDTALGLNGYIPHFTNPDLIFGIENAFSNGDHYTRKFSLCDKKKFS